MVSQSTPSSNPSFLVSALDSYRDTAKEFADKLQKGQVEEQEFGEYIYGQHGSKSRYDDGRSNMLEQERQYSAQLEREVRDRVRQESERGNIYKSQ